MIPIPIISQPRRIPFTPLKLFASGEQGVWYDPSDLTLGNMYQDSGKTMPVTGVEQPVGWIQDKSGRGNHAFQGTTTARPTLRALYNELICQTTLSTQSITTVATSYTLRFTGTGTVTLSGTATGTLSAGTNAFTATAGTLTLTVSGTVSNAMLTPTNEASLPFQSVTSRTLGSGVYDSDVTKFPVYLEFDGSDDSMSTNSINFSATDKVSVFAGVRRLTDTANTVCELSANWNNNTGTFFAWTGTNVTTGTGSAFNSASRGNASAWFNQYGFTPTTFTPPVTAVIAATHDISGDLTVVRGNAVAGTNGTGDKGAGNFGNYPLYIGARNNASLRFTGRIYSLIIRGALTETPLLEQTENWVEAKTFGKDMSYVYSDEVTTADGELITTADGQQIYMSVNYQ